MTWRTADDQVMAELRNWLIEQGFVVLADDYHADAFGNQDVTLARPVAIRLVKDRSQSYVEACGRDGQWRPLPVWAEAMGHGRPTDYSAPGEAEHLRRLLGEVERRPDAADGR